MFQKNILKLVLFIFVLFLLNGCKEDSNPSTPQTPHFEAEGLIIQDATKKIIFAVHQGIILREYNGQILQDTLVAPLNALSDHFSVKFLDANKNIINPPTDSDHSLGFNITDKSILSVVQDDPKEYAFHLKGLKEGKTTIEFLVNHMGHSDFRTPKIPVKVVVDTTKHGEPIAVLFSYEENNQQLASATTNSTTGKITLKLRDTTEHIKIEFLDENNKKFQPEYPLHNFELVFDDNTIATFIREADEPWVVRFIGKKIGTTKFQFKLIVNGNAEFVSSKINVEVTN
jgi:hypothetical protein